MISQLKLKVYYRFLELISLKNIRNESLEHSFKKCFIYYDYEREFSGHKTNISDLDVEYLLNHLDQVKLKTTWFTVGKVIEKYSETVHKIVGRGHEIGSHTFAHISPKVMNEEIMKRDFESFDKIRNKNNLETAGFHSPNGLWNVSMFDFLIKNEFTYDVISLPLKGQKILPKRFNFFKKYPIVRLITVGDDWPLYGANKSRLEVFEYFKELFEKTKKGDIFGIGFHPWILYSDKNILLGYEDFLSFITLQKDVVLKPAGLFAKEYSPALN